MTAVDAARPASHLGTPRRRETPSKIVPVPALRCYAITPWGDSQPTHVVWALCWEAATCWAQALLGPQIDVEETAAESPPLPAGVVRRYTGV
jgi:hypothetical protein